MRAAGCPPRNSHLVLSSSLTILFVAATLLSAAFCSPAVASPGFIENRGQLHEDVLYYLPGSPVSVYFTQDAIVFDLREEMPSPEQSAEGRLGPDTPGASIPLAGCAVHVWFDGAQTQPRLRPQGQQDARFNYFLANDPSKWHVDVPVFDEIVYQDVWPGADLVLRPNPAGLTYEVGVAGGTDLSNLRPVYEGATAATLMLDGSHLVETPVGNFVHRQNGTQGLAGEFVLAHSAEGSGTQDRLDGEGMVWSTYIGGTDGDTGIGVALTSSGNPVICGWTYSTDYPVTAGSYDLTHDGNYDVVVTELNESGSQLVWSTFIGGSSGDVAYGLTLSASGNWIVCGWTSSSDYPATAGAYDTSFDGGADLFVTKLSGSGNALIWSTYIGGASNDQCQRTALAESGEVFVSGWSNSTDFPTTAGAYDRTHNGNTDAVVCCLSQDGSNLLWGTYLGADAWDASHRIGVQGGEHPVIAGATTSETFPTTAGAYDETFNGIRDQFVAKLDGSSGSLLWSTLLGGSTQEANANEDYGLCLRPNGNVIIAGTTTSTDFPVTPGAYDETHNGGNYDLFVTELDASGSQNIWSTFIGGDAYDYMWNVALTDAGCPVVAAGTLSSNFPITPDTFDSSYNGNSDAIVAKLSPTGTELLWSSFFGGSSEDWAFGIFTGVLGEAYFTGRAHDGFPTTVGAYDQTYNGGQYGDSFCTKLDLPVVSACCIDEVCYIMTEDACISGGGEYKGDGVICEPDTCIPSDVGWDSELIDIISLALPTPHPVRGTLNAQFSLPTAGHATLQVLDPQGRVVATLVDQWMEAGNHIGFWQSGESIDLSTGVYFMKLNSDAGSVSKKILVLE